MTTTNYPARFHDHDPAIVALPEYHAARTAIDALVHAIARADVEINQDGFIAMAGDFASTNAYGDSCRGCRNVTGMVITFPYACEQTTPGNMRADYRCPRCGDTWMTGWAIDAPLHFA